ncbi:MAG TPA: hypothetical protein VFV87_18625, partial [Pirellulaceae bacterium]|nr:hypothetical protein [Pirellulaceae bacterium]
MPFDPKLIHPDQAPLFPDGEIDLPPDLAALGEQLRDDARHLAACYPADRDAANSLPAGKQRSRRWKRIAVMATSAAAT